MRCLFVPLFLLAVPAVAGRPSVAPPIEPVVRALGIDPEASVQLSPRHREIARQAGLQMISLCPDCRLSTITDDGPCGWARAQRKVLHQAAAHGHDVSSIVKTYVDLYGPQILARPPNDPIRRLSWGLPYIAIFVALTGLFMWARRRHKPTSTEAAVTQGAAYQSLQAELDALD